ncbi:chondroitin AC/alginate lyase [Dichomitus squalens]|nr:chondroitin AC/alginate lyase [Dichomitus squalens]
MYSSISLLAAAASLLTLSAPVLSFTSYANDFIDPKLILSKDFSNVTVDAQATILAWADELAAEGPWSVMNKTYAAPSGNKHDYMSWAPYWWPDCSKVGNTTELTPQQIWVTCPYVVKDGQFNPDGRTVDDVGEFDDIANAILYNALAWALTGTSEYSSRVAQYVSVWFLDGDTAMTPNLNYGQMQRGPTGQNGTHTGILDLKCMAKVVSGVLLLREGKAAEWTSDIDAGLTNWTTSYIQWLTGAGIALEEKAAPNNHGTFYYNQLAALQILVGDTTGANQTLHEYFTTQYQWQIAANGDQPLETARTRPYHYRAYNLAAMITNAKLGEYLGYSVWNLTTGKGTTIKDALDYAITLSPGNETADELWPNVVAVGAVYGDPDGSLANFMSQHAGSSYPSDAQFLWNQPFSDSGFVAASKNASDNAGAAQHSGTGNGAARLCRGVWETFAMGFPGAILTLLLAA